MAEQKTYSGTQAYHEMLVRAQALCPALLYVMCKMLLPIKLNPEEKHKRVYSESMNTANPSDPYYHYFGKDLLSGRMYLFLKEIFHDQTVCTGPVNNYDNQRAIYADYQFVRWLQSDVVTVDDELQLVTINL